MDPCYMNFGEVDSLELHHKMNCGIRVGSDIFRPFSVLGCGNSLVGGSAIWQFIVEN